MAALRTAEGNGPQQVQVPKCGVVFRDLRVFHRGVANHSPHPRHMMCVGYNAERDPKANCSHMGAGKVPHIFSADEHVKAVLTADSRYPIDRNATFAEDDDSAEPLLVDHFGNVASATTTSNDGTLQPYKRGDRDRFWLPMRQLTAEEGTRLPSWAKEVAADGKALSRGTAAPSRL